jgi:hypothetical protein
MQTEYQKEIEMTCLRQFIGTAYGHIKNCSPGGALGENLTGVNV